MVEIGIWGLVKTYGTTIEGITIHLSVIFMLFLWCLSNCQCTGFSIASFKWYVFVPYFHTICRVDGRDWDKVQTLTGRTRATWATRRCKKPPEEDENCWTHIFAPKIESLHMLDTHILSIPHSPRWLWSRVCQIFSGRMPHDSDFWF
jgi:hypothetical protein